MTSFRLKFCAALLFLLCLGSVLPCRAQVPSAAQTVLILPFENRSKSPGLEWIGESFAEILSQRLASASLYIISRDDRLYAFDRLGIPANTHPSRATVYRIAEQMDSDYVVMGDYNFDGQIFTARARVLDMKRLREFPVMQSTGLLVNLIELQTNLAWELLKTVLPHSTISREELMRSSAPIRLDAFESYVRGILAGTRQEKVKRFREAVRINPQYTLAILQLGKTYFANHDYESAASWLTRIPQGDATAGEAYFFLGLACYYQGQLDRAEEAFKVTLARLPLTEVYNNLGAIAIRRGRKSAAVYLQRAVEVDRNDPDYRFNLALALYRANDPAGAAKNLRDLLAKYPADGEARQLLDEASNASAAPGHGGDNAAAANSSAINPQNRLPLPRLKRNYDETSYRLLALEIQNSGKPAADLISNKSTAFHVQHGMELLDHGLTGDAEKEFREALMGEPGNAAAHAGMARTAEAKGDAATARGEAESSIRLRPTAAAYLVLARIDMKQSQMRSAAHNVDQALLLEPANAEALTLKREIAARETQPTEQPQRETP